MSDQETGGVSSEMANLRFPMPKSIFGMAKAWQNQVRVRCRRRSYSGLERRSVHGGRVAGQVSSF